MCGQVEKLLFSPEEDDFYQALRTQSKTRFDAFVAEGRVLNNYASVLAMLSQVHPPRLSPSPPPSLAFSPAVSHLLPRRLSPSPRLLLMPRSPR